MAGIDSVASSIARGSSLGMGIAERRGRSLCADDDLVREARGDAGGLRVDIPI
jgi:hypothetical protein